MKSLLICSHFLDTGWRKKVSTGIFLFSYLVKLLQGFISKWWPLPLWASINVQTWELKSHRLIRNPQLFYSTTWGKTLNLTELQIPHPENEDNIMYLAGLLGRLYVKAKQSDWNMNVEEVVALLLFYIQVKFTQCKFNHFKVCNSVTFSTFTILCINCLSLFPNIFIMAKGYLAW